MPRQTSPGQGTPRLAKPSRSSPRISIVTPWHEHRELADDYFEALLPEIQDGDKVIIVDNGSEPPLPFGTVVAPTNLGYCGGSNLGLGAAQAEATLFLNNDVKLGRRGWLADIRIALEPGVLVGPLRYGRHAAVDGQAMPYIDGWCLAGMTDDLRQLGGFDETLAEPAYYSDNLLCLEARAQGLRLRDVRVGLLHLENVTAGRGSEPHVQAASAANRDRYLARARELLVAA